jgi:transposase
MYLDECHFYQHGTRYRMWVPPEDHDPVVIQEPTRKGISVFGAVDPCTGIMRTGITDKYNAITFREFLMIISPLSGEIHMILDNARYHHARILNEFLENNPNIILEFLPPYSPELNAIERVWKIIRSKGTHNRYFPSIGDLIMAVAEQFDLYSRPNNVLKRLCAIT